MSTRTLPIAGRVELKTASIDRLKNPHYLRQVLGIVSVIGLMPILATLVLRLPLINQLNYADPWFYSTYAWAPKHGFEIFGWNYFGARFPAILGIGLFKRLFGVGGGYVLLRYTLAIACGTSVYLCVRRLASVPVALSTVALLYLQPFFSRMLLWDYSGFAEITAGVIGVALWYWSDGRRLAWTLLPGAALASAVFANALFGTALFALFAVEAVAALRQGRHALRNYCARLVIVVCATIGVFSIGYLSYVEILGSFNPYQLLRPTIEFLRENSKNSAPYQAPISHWLLHEPRLWMPVITSVALLAVLRRRVLGVNLSVRIAQLCIVYTGFLWLYRFTVTSSLIETWWAYSVVVVATAPAVGVLLHELLSKYRASKHWPAVAVATFALTAILVRDVPNPAASAYHAIAGHRSLLVGLLVIGLASAVLTSSRRTTGRVASSIVFVVILAVMSYAPSVLDGRGTTGVFVTNGAREWKVYEAGEQFIDLVQDYDSPSHRVFLWWPGIFGYVSITWTDLPQTADTLNEVGVDESLDHLTSLGTARLEQPQVRYIMILSPQLDDLSKAHKALVQGGFWGSVVRSGEFAGGELYFTLVTVRKK
jgi:hypothetical protein